MTVKPDTIAKRPWMIVTVLEHVPKCLYYVPKYMTRSVAVTDKHTSINVRLKRPE